MKQLIPARGGVRCSLRNRPMDRAYLNSNPKMLTNHPVFRKRRVLTAFFFVMESNSSPTPSTSSPGSVNSRSEDVPASSGTFVPDPYPFVVWRMPLSHPAPGSLLRTVLRRDSSSASNWLSTPWRGGWAPGRLLEPDRLSVTPTGRPDSPDVGYSSPASGLNPDFDDYFWDPDNP